MTTNEPSTASNNGNQSAGIQTSMNTTRSGVTRKPSSKKPTSFNIDPELLIRFKAGCVHQGRPMSSIIEELMLQYISKVKC